jgi:phytoene dehydrogenase-like protein
MHADFATMQLDHDMIVIGSGPSGRRAAVQSAKLGKSVLVVEKGRRVGGMSVPALCFGFLGVNIYLVLLFGAVFQTCVLVLNTTIWIYAPELYPTRIRGLGDSPRPLRSASRTIMLTPSSSVAGRLARRRSASPRHLNSRSSHRFLPPSGV